MIWENSGGLNFESGINYVPYPFAWRSALKQAIRARGDRKCEEISDFENPLELRVVFKNLN